MYKRLCREQALHIGIIRKAMNNSGGFVALFLLLALFSSSLAALQRGNEFPDGVKVGFNGATQCNSANKGLLQFDEEGDGSLHLCNGTTWVLVSAPENATVLSRTVLSTDIANDSVVVSLLHDVLEQLLPAQQQRNIFCSGHGAFVAGVESTDDDTCECYQSNTLGHYQGVRCSICSPGWSFDSSGLCIVDTEKPVGVLLGADIVTTEAGVPFSDPGASFEDNSGESIVAVSDASSSVNVMLLGTYNVTYTGEDSWGNIASIHRLVVVLDTQPPVIDFTGIGDTVNIMQYDSLALPPATAMDVFDGDVSGSLSISPTLNTSIAGITEYLYSAIDASGNVGYGSYFVNVSNVNECELPSADPHVHQCHLNATCIPNDNSGFYDCTCNGGYIGDGFNCIFDTGPVVFTHTGDTQFYTVPNNVHRIFIKAWGGGSAGGAGCFGAVGGFAYGELDVTPGQTYAVVVGGAGVFQSSDYASGGFGGGGTTGRQVGTGYGGAGGGMSGLFTGGSAITFDASGQSRALIIAGGAGGGGSYYNQFCGNAGSGGGLSGQMGTPNSQMYASYSANPDSRRGYPGTQTSGGRGCTSEVISGAVHDGTVMQGGQGGLYGGAGGGGGYYGGGGASPYSNAGGGSGYIHPSLHSASTTTGGFGDANNLPIPPATGDEHYQSGVATGGTRNGSGGHGLVVIGLVV